MNKERYKFLNLSTDTLWQVLTVD